MSMCLFSLFLLCTWEHLCHLSRFHIYIYIYVNIWYLKEKILTNLTLYDSLHLFRLLGTGPWTWSQKQVRVRKRVLGPLSSGLAPPVCLSLLRGQKLQVHHFSHITSSWRTAPHLPSSVYIWNPCWGLWIHYSGTLVTCKHVWAHISCKRSIPFYPQHLSSSPCVVF